jgi:hypothetical protein
MNKPRSDAKLLNLPEEQHAQLVEWLLSGLPYHQVKLLVKKQFEIDTSLGALSAFYQDCCSAVLLARRQQAVSTADEIAAAASAMPGQFDQATIDALKQKAFELSIQPFANPKDVKAIFSLVLKARDQDLEARRIAVLEAKAKRADEAEQVVREDLTPEEKEARLKGIFGMS